MCSSVPTLLSVLDDDGNLRVLPIIGRGSVQSVADILFLTGKLFLLICRREKTLRGCHLLPMGCHHDTFQSFSIGFVPPDC
jgi:hypothetical protein